VQLRVGVELGERDERSGRIVEQVIGEVVRRVFGVGDPSLVYRTSMRASSSSSMSTAQEEWGSTERARGLITRSVERGTPVYDFAERLRAPHSHRCGTLIGGRAAGPAQPRLAVASREPRANRASDSEDDENATAQGMTWGEKNDAVFVYYSAIQMDGYRTLEEGQRVEFDVGPGKKGHEAQNVRLAWFTRPVESEARFDTGLRWVTRRAAQPYARDLDPGPRRWACTHAG
jgi:CspA family cold shock protein